MLVVTVNFQARSDKVTEFRDAILFQARSARENETGCRQFDVCQSSDDPTRFFVYEIYDDEAAFEVHRNSPHSAIARERIKDLLAERELTIWSRIDGK